ncbi:MAG TPA: hydroxylamine reductase [Planctomycetaceae bacterium]|nr:hydroxylamine reductase [Planctomycetaceae bacterium]
MFCFQCEQTGHGTGCTTRGVCGKHDTTAVLQDAIIQTVKEIGFYNDHLRASGKRDAAADHLTLDLLFATVTNVDFDDRRLYSLFQNAIATADRLRRFSGATLPAGAPVSQVDLHAAKSGENLVEIAGEIAISRRKEAVGEDILALQELLTYGIKGTAAYAHHALILGKEADAVYAFFAKALSSLATGNASMDEWAGLVLECGHVNLKAMELLDAGNTEHFGHPQPTQVRITPKKGKAIAISGHDLLDLEELLKQTEGKGINVYTHGEMLPAHGYPELKRYSHLVGNYGGAWQDQHKEFTVFPGSILMTTNCIQNPKGYEKRIFTTGCVAYPELVHIEDRKPGGMKDFTPVIEAALAGPGFAEDGEDKSITVGFGREAVMSVAGKVIDAVNAGKIRRFFLIGGCDGAKTGRNYYTEFAEKVPKDCVILTLACGKYRFNKLEFGDIDGIPRLLDIGQCNDAYSAIQIAVALAKAFETDVNSLPLSFVLSWYEQKAVCILLTLLALGIKGIKLGPSLPAFVSPNVLNMLVEKFAIAPISTVEEDLKAALS